MDNSTPIPFQIRVWQSAPALIDPQDSDLRKFRWHDRNGYPSRMITIAKKKRRTIYMHILILERVLNRPLLKGEECDHVDGNKHNNQRSNLRLATRQQNTHNTKRRSTNSTGFKGVVPFGNRFRAFISVDKQQLYLGTYDTPEQAHEAYKLAAIAYFGDFARFE